MDMSIGLFSLNPDHSETSVETEQVVGPIVSFEENFISIAQARLKQEPLPVIKMPDQNDVQFIASAKAALSLSHYNDRGQGGLHCWISTKKINGFLLKHKLSNNILNQEDIKMNKQVDMIEKARKICEAKNLYLLCVPQSALLSIDDNVMIQEKLDLEHDWDKQKKLYKWVTKEPRLQSYAKEIFRQLIVFVCEMRYRDVKYINNPLIRDGRIGLIDLDENFPGLGGDKDHGVFRMIPLSWYDEFTAIASASLQEKDRKISLEEIQKIREHRERKKQIKIKLQEYYARNNITRSAQPIKNFNKSANPQVSENIAAFASMFINILNKKLQLYVDGPINSVKKRTHEFDDNELPRIGKGGYWQVFDSKKEGLETLKQLGYIFDYLIHSNPRFFSVTF